ncbi:MAG: NUDIX domain-containing protein [Candidatus Falkowbacteria bacterium]
MPHIHDKIDFTVEVFIVYKDRVLLRKHDKYKMWLSVGGHVELDEDPNEAALREVREETGLNIKLVGEVKKFAPLAGYKELMSPRFLNRHYINETHEHVTLVYFATTDDNKVIQGEKEISDDIHWFTATELDNSQYTLRESVRYYAQEALKELND